MITIVKTGSEGIPLIQGLSQLIWPATYRQIITEEQSSYMLELMYSTESLAEQINLKYHQFIIAYDHDKPVAFSSYGPKPETDDVFRLHKLYILPGCQGKGIGKKLIQFIVDDIMPKGGKKLELNVNKFNPAKGFYERAGFRIIREEKINIGQDFFMDDFVMETQLPGFFVS